MEHVYRLLKGFVVGAVIGLVFLTNAIAADKACVSMDAMKAEAVHKYAVIHTFRDERLAAVRYEIKHFKGGQASNGARDAEADHAYVMDGEGTTVLFLFASKGCITGSILYSVDDFNQILDAIIKDTVH